MAELAAAFLTGDISQCRNLTADALKFVRRHFQMDVAFFAERTPHGLQVGTAVAPGFEHVIFSGQYVPGIERFFDRVLKGELPELVPDTKSIDWAKGIKLARGFSVRAFVGVPVLRPDGSVFGLFCCLARNPCPSLNARDLEVARALATMSGDQEIAQRASERENQSKTEAIRHILETCGFDIALQPIRCLQQNGTAGYEALCRFQTNPYRPPNQWFDDAAEVGLQTTLELNVIRVALHILPQLPDEAYLAINTSAATLASGELPNALKDVDTSRIVLEITEHDAIEDIDLLLMEVDRLRDMGVRIAVDDAGAGYSGLQHILRIRPDVIKLDMSLTQDVDKDLARRSLTSAMVKFAHDTNARVVAEGIETEDELRTLRKLGVEWGQGYHLGRPALASTVLPLARRA